MNPSIAPSISYSPSNQQFWSQFLWVVYQIFQKSLLKLLFGRKAVSCALKKEEILKDWNWIETNLMPTLVSFDNEDDVTEFVRCKIESLIAQAVTEPIEAIESSDSRDFRATSHRFARLFAMPEEEKLVNCLFYISFVCNLRPINCLYFD